MRLARKRDGLGVIDLFPNTAWPEEIKGEAAI